MVLHKVWINSFFLQSKVLFLSCPLPFLFYWLCFWNFFPLYLSFPFLPFPFLPSSLLPPFLSPLFSSFLPSFCSSLNNCFSLSFFTVLNSKPTPKVLRRLGKQIPDDWQGLGVELGVDQSTIRNILANNIQFPKPDQKACEMLLRWSQMTDSPTYRKLEEAVEQVGRHDLAVWLLKNTWLTLPANLQSDFVDGGRRDVGLAF